MCKGFKTHTHTTGSAGGVGQYMFKMLLFCGKRCHKCLSRNYVTLLLYIVTQYLQYILIVTQYKLQE